MDKKEYSFKEIRKLLEEQFEKRIPGVLEIKNELMKNKGNEIVNLLQLIFKKQFSEIKEIAGLQFSIVVDNNFVLGQIKGVIKNNGKIESSLLYKLVNSCFVDVYAPQNLKEELFAKIELDIAGDRDQAIIYANLIISKIKIEDAPFVSDHKKANDYIGDGQLYNSNMKKSTVDKDDVPYLALVFHKKTHGIVSMDKVFKRQSESKVWKISETESVLITYNEGIISFTCLAGIAIIGKLLFDVVKIICIFIYELIIDIIAYIQLLIKTGIIILKEIPAEVYLGITLFLVSSLKVEDFSIKNLDKLLLSMENKITILIGYLKDVKNSIQAKEELFKKVSDATITSGKLLTILIMLCCEMAEQIEEMKKIKVKE